jgi:GGDEF domain-containing protein
MPQAEKLKPINLSGWSTARNPSETKHIQVLTKRIALLSRAQNAMIERELAFARQQIAEERDPSESLGRISKIQAKARALLEPRQLRLIQRISYDENFPAVLKRSVFLLNVGGQLLRKQPHSFAMFDLDRFKKFNDIFGHAAGDLVLDMFSKAMRQVADDYGGFAARWGGEEFAIYAPVEERKMTQLVQFLRVQVETSFRQRIKPVLEKAMAETPGLREKVQEDRELFWALEKNLPFSCGFFSFDKIEGSPKDFLKPMIETADHALYISKRKGRNRVTIAGKRATTIEL